uniref:Uncharacterized protein n=1 Tax=Romanomermis culicivorax TaxID=13658 RepID=A0A915KK29_ROMCU
MMENIDFLYRILENLENNRERKENRIENFRNNQKTCYRLENNNFVCCKAGELCRFEEIDPLFVQLRGNETEKLKF